MKKSIELSANGVPDTGWRCSVCFTYAQVMTCGEMLCVDHAKQWDAGYGKSLKQLKKEFNKQND